jgi:exopolysaccharide production protein ExoQ
MNHEGVAPTPAIDLRAAAAVCAVPVLIAIGYAGLSQPAVAGAVLAVVALAAWTIVAYQRPAFAVAMSFPLLLLAGTKFRVRDAGASLDGVLDAQIVLEVGLFALIGVATAAAWLATRRPARLSKIELVIGAYALFALASTLWSAAPMLTLVRGTQLAILAGLAMMAVHVMTPLRTVWLATRGVAWYVLICATLALSVPLAATTYEAGDGARFAWFSTHPIDAGGLAAIGALGLLALGTFAYAHGLTRRSPVLMRVGVAALVAILLLTRSRGPLAAFCAGAFALWLMRLRPALRTSVMLSSTAVALTAFVFAEDLAAWFAWLSDQNSLISRIVFRGESADTVLEMNGRLGLWGDLQPTIAGQLMTGYGYQASRPILLEAAPWAAYAHNAVLQTMLDLGLLGTLLLCVIIVAALRGAFGAARRENAGPLAAAAGALIVFLTVNSVSTESFAGAPGVETLLLFVCALCAAGIGSGAPSATATQP